MPTHSTGSSRKGHGISRESTQCFAPTCSNAGRALSEKQANRLEPTRDGAQVRAAHVARWPDWRTPLKLKTVMVQIRRLIRFAGLYILLPGLVLIASAALMVWRRPVTVVTWVERWSLSRSAFSRVAIQAPSGRLIVWEHGQGAPLVLLHGFGNRAASARDIGERLAAGHHVLMPDLPGHGESDSPPGPMTFGVMLQSIDAVIDYVHAPRVIVVGTSLGGALAVYYARQHPDRVARVIDVSAVVPFAWVSKQLAVMANLPNDRLEARRAVSEAMGWGSRTPLPGFLVDDIIRTTRAHPARTLFSNAADPERDWTDERLSEVPTPVDIVWGGFEPGGIELARKRRRAPNRFCSVSARGRCRRRAPAERYDLRGARVPGGVHADQVAPGTAVVGGW